jgi:ABC-type sulfate transport system substrate-binding protein
MKRFKIYKTVTAVLYVPETQSFTLREEHILRASENIVVRKIYGARKDELTKEWRKEHNEELHNFVLFSIYY